MATNIAETSLTVRGVTAVIDTGLQKVARYDADRGVDSLTTERITLDSADQRAGRAARLGPGIVAAAVGRARSAAAASRGRDSSRRSVGAVLSILAWGASTRHASSGSIARRPIASRRRSTLLDAAWRGRGRPHHRSSAGRCSACRCIRGWRAS